MAGKMKWWAFLVLTWIGIRFVYTGTNIARFTAGILPKETGRWLLERHVVDLRRKPDPPSQHIN